MNELEENPYRSPLIQETLSQEVLLSMKERRWRIARIMAIATTLGWAAATLVGMIVERVITNGVRDDIAGLGAVGLLFIGVPCCLIVDKSGEVLEEVEEQRKSLKSSP